MARLKLKRCLELTEEEKVRYEMEVRELRKSNAEASAQIEMDVQKIDLLE
jgi:hypothetical protein